MANGLATRCPSCTTVFRVVLDQLRVSEGWVRCGRCSEVFNAAQALVDLDTGEPRRVVFDPPAAAPSSSSQAPAATDQQRDTAVDEPAEEPPLIDSLESTFAVDAAAADPAALPEPDITAEADAAADVMPLPSFVRRAERVQRWRQPRVRAALAVLAALSAIGLAAQMIYEYRDQIAARLPGTHGLLTAACQAAGCTIGPARAIEAISVESSGLVRVEQSTLYRLTVALRNRAGFDVAVPAVDLAITDGQGKLLARRVLRPAEMGAPQPALGSGRDLMLQATLQMATEPVAGYTVELFYP